MTDLQRILNMVVRMDAHDARKVRDMADGRLRELDQAEREDEACDVCHEEVDHRFNCPEGIAFSNYAPSAFVSEGLELLPTHRDEEAVRRSNDV